MNKNKIQNLFLILLWRKLVFAFADDLAEESRY